MFDLLKPGYREARPGVPVQQEPACLGEQPGIGRVPAVDRDTDATGRIRPAYLGGLELRHPPDLPPGRVHVARADAEFGQQQLHVIGRRQAERRPEDEPDHRGRSPADGQAPQHVERQPVTSHRRGQGHQGDEDLDEALHASRQVGQRRGGHRGEQGDLQDRERQVVPVDHDPARSSAVASEQENQDAAHRRRAGRTQREVTRDHPAARDQGQPHQDDHDADRASLVDHRHQPGDAPRRRMDDLDDGLVDAGVVVDDEHAAHQGEHGQGQAHSVASAPASLTVADRSEHDRTPVTQQVLLRNGARILYEVFSHAGPTASPALPAAGVSWSRGNLGRADLVGHAPFPLPLRDARNEGAVQMERPQADLNPCRVPTWGIER